MICEVFYRIATKFYKIIFVRINLIIGRLTMAMHLCLNLSSFFFWSTVDDFFLCMERLSCLSGQNSCRLISCPTYGVQIEAFILIHRFFHDHLSFCWTKGHFLLHTRAKQKIVFLAWKLLVNNTLNTLSVNQLLSMRLCLFFILESHDFTYRYH